MANGNSTKPFAIDNLTVSTNNPPRITVTSPTSGIAYTTASTGLALGGTAADDAAVTQVTWTNNRGGSGTATGTSAWSIASIPLALGANVITVTASNALGFTGSAVYTVTRIVPGTLQLSSSSYQLMESAGAAVISVTRSGGTDGAVSVAYATSNGTATAGLDYTATSGTLNWADGDAVAKTFSVPLRAGTATSGDLTLNLALSNPTAGATLGSPASAVLTIHHAPTDHWRFRHFGASANNAAISGDLANPSGDGIVNLLKYALNLDPLHTSASGLPFAGDDGTWLTLTYTRVLAETDISYQVEWTDDFQMWSSSGVIDEILSDDGITRQIKAKVSLGGAGNRFMRLNITRP
jgi:hypothetical protein